MIKFPMNFEVSANSGPGIQHPWSSKADEFPPISCAIPPEFSGPGGTYSPEDLFAISLLSCLIATFKVYAEKSNIQFENLEGKANLTVDRHPSESVFYMSQVDITFNLKGASDPEKAKSLLEKSIQDCAVSNSIKSGKTFQINLI